MYEKLENIDKIPTNQRNELRNLVEDMDDILTRGGIGKGMIHDFFYDCVNGQIVCSLMPRKSKEKYHNKLSDFYIDSRVGFRGIRDVVKKLRELKDYFRRITKYRPRRFAVGDTVRIKKHPQGNAVLRSNPQFWGKTAKVKKLTERSLSDLDYEGLYIQIGGKGNWIYVGSQEVTKVIRRA